MSDTICARNIMVNILIIAEIMLIYVSGVVFGMVMEATGWFRDDDLTERSEG